MNLHTRVFLLLLIICLNFSLAAQPLKVSEDGRFLVKTNGEPFIWIGDTAWELFHKLDRDEATEYLENRSKKGFTLIQAVVLAENDGLRTPNPYGEVPLFDLDPGRPNPKYFAHVDFIVNKAEQLGLVVGMLPTWGDKLETNNPGAGPVVFNPENAAIYGEYLGARYKNKPVIWILGGDRNVDNPTNREIWKAMALGIKKGDQGRNLQTYHPRGGATSAYWFHNEPWLDFNMYQSGHEKHFHQVYEFAEYLLLMKPRKPFVDGEPAYEDISLRFWEFMDFSKPGYQRVPAGVLNDQGIIKDRSHFEQGFFTDYDVRIHAYWNFLAGACGYTYGNNAIWQMFKKGGKIAIPALSDWREAMDRPGAEDMTHVRALFESRPFQKLIPDQAIIYGINPNDKHHVRAAGAIDGSYLLIYLAVGQPVTVQMNKIDDQEAQAWWYNPRNGESTNLGAFRTDDLHEFQPPRLGEGHDWMLVIDAAQAGYKAPGRW
ncbi:MAG: glycoside hydrolase family 140 protein [Candidatus Cyclobacteriaceae bacterium M3_2C_046]